MNEEMMALGRRAVACKGWRWLPGMRVTLSSGLTLRLGEHDEGSLWWAIRDGGATFTVDMSRPSYTVAPDLNDGATLGCLLALVREAWDDPKAYVRAGRGWEWVSDFYVERCPPRGETEAEALVAALEAAPGVKHVG